MSGHPPSDLQQDTLSKNPQRFWLQWVESAFPDLDSRAYFLPPVYFNPVSMSRQCIAAQEVPVLHEAPGQAGQLIPGQAGQSTPGETGASKHPTNPQAKAGQNVPDDPSPPKKPGKVERIAGRYRQLFSTSRTETTGEECGAPIQDIDIKDDADSRYSLQLVQTTLPDHNSGAFYDYIPSIAGQEVLVLPKPCAQAGESTPGQSGLSTHKQAGQLTPEENGPSNQLTMTAAHPTDPHPQLKKGLKVPDVLSPPKKAVKVKSLTHFQDSDVRDDAALQRVLLCLQKMSEINREVLVGLSQLQFGQYLGEPCYAAAAAQLPVPANLPSALPQNWKRGDFDVLLIHRLYGLVVCEVKTFGDNVQKLGLVGWLF